MYAFCILLFKQMKMPQFRTLIVFAISILSTLIAFATAIVPAIGSEHNKKEVGPPRNYRDNDRRHHDMKSPPHHGVGNNHSHPTVTKNPPPTISSTPPQTTISSTPPQTTISPTPPPTVTNTPPNPCRLPTTSVPPSTRI
jgi:hypothetical protein